MASEINRYTKKAIKVIPFGIDTKKFKPSTQEQNDTIVIGTVRKLQKLYGVDVLIRAFKIIVDQKK